MLITSRKVLIFSSQNYWNGAGEVGQGIPNITLATLPPYTTYSLRIEYMVFEVGELLRIMYRDYFVFRLPWEFVFFSHLCICEKCQQVASVKPFIMAAVFPSEMGRTQKVAGFCH